MAYIGRDTDKISNVEVLDNITFDGSSSYTLQKGGSNFTPSSANTLLLSIDGVVQAGNFTVSGSTIDFGTAVAGTSTCDFILHYGVGLITAPSDGSVTEAKIGTGAVTSSKLASGAVPNQSAFKNIIINGDMSIAQRGTSTSGVTTSDGYYACDRWRTQTDTGTWTISQDTDVPTGQGYYYSMKLNCTSAGTSNADEVTFIQRIEGQFLQYLKFGTSNAESLTASFWIKTNKTGTYSAVLENQNSDQLRVVSFDYTVNSANTWEKKTITFPGDTSRIIKNTNSNELDFKLYFSSAYGTGVTNTWQNYSANYWSSGNLAGLGGSTSDYVNITGVQLEAGTTASDFEFLPYDVNLQRCQRYYQVIAPNDDGSIAIVQYQANFRALVQVFSTEMRAVPTFTVDTYSNFTAFNGSALSTNHIFAYEDISYSTASSLTVKGVRLDAEL